MKVMVIVKASKDSEAGKMPGTELLAAMGKYNEELAKAGILLAMEGLQSSSKGARVHFSGKSRVVTDGPFSETKELIAGFWLWKVNSLQEAIDWVKKCPNPMPGDSDIEIRPVFTADDFGEEFTPELREQEATVRAMNLGLGAPAYQRAPARTIVGVNGRYTPETRLGIHRQWEQFVPTAAGIPGKTGADFYGVCWNTAADCSFDYLTGVEVSPAGPPPGELVSVNLNARRYAVFSHAGHVSTISKAIDTLWTQWAPESGLPIAGGTPCFERYTPEFNPQTGMGGMEIWIPLKA